MEDWISKLLQITPTTRGEVGGEEEEEGGVGWGGFGDVIAATPNLSR